MTLGCSPDPCWFLSLLSGTAPCAGQQGEGLDTECALTLNRKGNISEAFSVSVLPFS